MASYKELLAQREQLDRQIKEAIALEKAENILAQTVRDVCKEFHETFALRAEIEEKKARVELQFPADGSDVIEADRFYWDQIFFNLIENALKENQADGKLILTISFNRTKGESVICIRDNGVGIPRADLPFIFKRFYRVAKHHSQTIKGTGLGLSIVRRAIESHGGTITVDSTLGVETIFTIRLPDLTEAERAVTEG